MTPTESALKHVVEVFQTRRRRLDHVDRFQLGFTGARRGPTAAQGRTFHDLLWTKRYPSGIRWERMPAIDFHSGCALGADRYVVADTPESWHHYFHPADRYGFNWANLQRVGSRIAIANPKPPLDRNHDIVDASEALVAMPNTEAEIMRSGTWATIRYARKTHVPVLVIRPDGSLGWDGSLRGREP